MSATPQIEFAFPHQYEAEVITDTGGTRPVRIPDAGEDVDSLLVRITPAEGAPWVGAFARGYASDDLVTGLFGWPDGKSLAVVSAGYGYVVPAADPTAWVRLQPNPITQVCVLREQGVLVFADFTHLFAYNAERSLWKSERLSWDGITITQVATHHIFGLAWDATADKEVEFALDVRTGAHTGGAKPWAKR